MRNPDDLFGRLGNRMFQGAFCVSYALDTGVDRYFQDEAYFQDHADTIRRMFSDGIGEPLDRIALQVRRGDYVDNPFYVDLSKTDYYEKAMALFPNEKFLVQSDDIEWCKEYFKGEQFEFCEQTGIEAMNIMSACKGCIMANSSFSWWASWLNPNYPNNKVVAPNVEHWNTDGVERCVCPSHWVRI